MGLGMQLTLRSYRVYMASVLLFVGQLEDLPETFEGVERTACRRLFPGPNNLITPGVLKNLKSIGLPAELANESAMAVAAKSRVYSCAKIVDTVAYKYREELHGFVE